MKNNLPRNSILDRQNLILTEITNKSVLNIGCSDYPYTEQKILNNQLFHSRMGQSASALYGIDLSKDGIETMKKYGSKNVYEVDIYNLDTVLVLQNIKFDVIVISEVLEHLPNVGTALEKVCQFGKKTNPAVRIIITVPNIHNFIFRFIDMFKNVENVHPDHYYYFSYHTISKILEDNGCKVVDFKYVLYHKKSIFYTPILALFNVFSSSFLPYCYVECQLK